MPNQKQDEEVWGSIISVDAQVKAPRGATKTFSEGLNLVLAGMILDDQACIIMHPDYLVARSAYPATDVGEVAYSNQRQTLAGRLRSHHEELVRRGDLPTGTRLSINWAPDGAITKDGVDISNRPQCSLRKRA